MDQYSHSSAHDAVNLVWGQFMFCSLLQTLISWCLTVFFPKCFVDCETSPSPSEIEQRLTELLFRWTVPLTLYCCYRLYFLFLHRLLGYFPWAVSLVTHQWTEDNEVGSKPTWTPAGHLNAPSPPLNSTAGRAEFPSVSVFLLWALAVLSLSSRSLAAAELISPLALTLLLKSDKCLNCSLQTHTQFPPAGCLSERSSSRQTVAKRLINWLEGFFDKCD